MKKTAIFFWICMATLTLSACSGIKLTDPNEELKGTQTTVVNNVVGFNEYAADEKQKEELARLQQEEAERLRKQEEARKQREQDLKEQEEQRIRQEEQESPPPRRGTTAGGAYANKYLGLKFEPSFGFIFYNREEMGELVGQDSKVYTVENLISDESPVDSIYEMMAVDLHNNNVVICFENLGKSGHYSYTEAQYLRSIYKALIEDQNYTCNWEARGSYMLAGTEYQTIQATVQANGKTYTQGYFVKKYGKYFVQIIVTAEPEAYPVLLDSFSAIE